ncbi:C-terminal binding protein [Natrarchaeobius chitinivorans]|uniref:C-terminal binding protein n=1 Tax=Natrarchaeobius chitinivorans TaxID=1679083 RepID=A0A3N6NA42_NATCH|nr:C-terminal binding protein [Natrarchaeobius chitinivorans]RQG95452.1 C-terminal binding protein [Natrarchaeobius chitinivorans]
MRVVVTRRIFRGESPYDDVVEAAGGELVYADCHTEEDAVAVCEGADIVVRGSVPITERVMEAAGELRLILVPAAGYDCVDIREATSRGIPVSNVPEYAPRDVASHAMSLALAAAHDVVRCDRDMRDGPGWERRRIHPIHGKTFGIVGLGRIGREIVSMARGMGTDVIAYDPYLPSDIFDHVGVEPVEFDELLERSECISIHAPLTDTTRNMFSTEAFSRMRESAILVNAARGPIVDESALVDAIENGDIRAAALDVFETEPPTDSPVLDCERIVVSPHMGSTSPSARQGMIRGARQELKRALSGEPLENVVNPEVFQYTGDQAFTPDE